MIPRWHARVSLEWAQGTPQVERLLVRARSARSAHEKGLRPFADRSPSSLSVLVAWGLPRQQGPLRGCHLHRTETKAVQWITSFVGRATAMRAPTLRPAGPPKTAEPSRGTSRAIQSVRPLRAASNTVFRYSERSLGRVAAILPGPKTRTIRRIPMSPTRARKPRRSPRSSLSLVLDSGRTLATCGGGGGGGVGGARGSAGSAPTETEAYHVPWTVVGPARSSPAGRSACTGFPRPPPRPRDRAC